MGEMLILTPTPSLCQSGKRSHSWDTLRVLVILHIWQQHRKYTGPFLCLAHKTNVKAAQRELSSGSMTNSSPPRSLRSLMETLLHPILSLHSPSWRITGREWEFGMNLSW